METQKNLKKYVSDYLKLVCCNFTNFNAAEINHRYWKLFYCVFIVWWWFIAFSIHALMLLPFFGVMWCHLTIFLALKIFVLDNVVKNFCFECFDKMF